MRRMLALLLVTSVTAVTAGMIEPRLEEQMALLDAGATRLGCSAGVAIVSGGSGKDDY